MREVTDKDKIEQFMRELGRRARSECRVYFTGGATAVLEGWRDATIDIDLCFEPELDEVFRALPEIKEKLDLNVELAAPSDFIPPLPGWQERSRYIGREGKVSFFHYDLYSQALSKIERRHDKDMQDVDSMLQADMIEPGKLLELFLEIMPVMYKYPAIDLRSFERAVRKIVESRTD